MKRGALGRADLVRWADGLDEERLGRLAQACGFREEPKAPGLATLGGTLTGAIGVMHAVVADGAAPGDPGSPQPRQYRLVERRQLAPPPAPLRPPSTPTDTSVDPLGPPPPLIPWPRLWPFLRAALGDLAERNRVDLLRLVAACSRVKPLRRLPRLKGQRWAPQGQLILDLRPRLYPFWGDFDALKTALPRLRGETGLDILCMDQGPDGLVRPWDNDGWGPPRRYDLPPADTPVLIAGDLGCLGTTAERRAWIRLGRRLAGAGRVPVALTPCPPRWWDPDLAGIYFPVFLDRGAHIPPRPAGPCPWPARGLDVTAAMREDAGASLLLTLLSACVAIRPALLRHLRHGLPAHLADAGSEAAAWRHPAFAAADFALLPGEPGEIDRMRRAFPQTGDEAARRLAWTLIRAQQALGASRSQCLEELALFAAMTGRSEAEVEAFLDEVAVAMDQASQANDPERARSLAAWVNRRAERMHPDAWKYSPSSEALWLKANPQAEHTGAALPPGLDIHRSMAAMERPAQVRFWRLMQRGERLEVEPYPAADRPFASGSPVVEPFATRHPIMQVCENRPGAPELSLPLGEGAGLPLTETGWRLRTDGDELVIAPLVRPAWAHTLGRDGDGLFVRLNDGRGDRRAYWCSPGPAHPDWLPPRQPPLAYFGIDIEQGFFLDESQFRTVRDETFYVGKLGGSIGIGEYGLRAELSIQGVVQGFRWIWPGRFLMGSPETEEGRFDRETLHEVILTRGFWLAETACTQALWQAVMGANPSYTKGERRPVEQVSWDDVQRFMERLNDDATVGRAVARPGAAVGESTVGPGRPPLPAGPARAKSLDPKPDLQPVKFRLPTEAEWEYACRAGTDTAYSFGEAFDPKLANLGSETVDVRSLPPNPWGLYEMHGNVYEWCQDWFADYPAGTVVDPVGPASGRWRVLRGGSWIGSARFLRAAYRSLSAPGARLDGIGFRLALGPELRPETQAGKAGSGAGQPAQRASGSEREARAVRSRGAKGGKGS